MVNEKLTQKPEIAEISEDALIHVVEPNDISQGPDGSSYKMKVVNLPDITQDNIDIRKYINIVPTDRLSHILTKINNLPSYVINEKQSVWFICQDEIFFPITIPRLLKFKMMDKGKGTYGTGGTTIVQSDLELVYDGNATTGDLENNPTTDIVNFGDLTGQNVSQWLNLQNPAIVIKPQDEGYTIFKGTVDTVPFTYLWIGEPGVYGVGESTSTMLDFQELSDDVSSPQTLQQTNEAGNVTDIPMVVHDPDNEQKVSYEANGQVYTDSDGNTITDEFPEEAATGDAVYKRPAKTGTQTYAMLSDLDSRTINFKYPAAFTFRPFSIFSKGGVFYADKSNWDIVKDKVSKMMPYYLDYQNGSNSNDGRTSATAFKTLLYALSQGARLIYLRSGDVIKNDGFGTINGNTYSGDDIFLITLGGGNCTVVNSILSPSFSLYAGTTYSASISGSTVTNVADFEFVNGYGLPSNLNEETSIANVEVTPNSYFISGTTIYVNLQDGRVPDSSVHLLKTSTDNRINVDAGYIYNEGITYIGGNMAYQHRGQTTVTATSTANYFARRCKYLYADTNGFGVTSNKGITWLEECVAYRNGRDGFNYSQGTTYATTYGTSRNIEINCNSLYSGYKDLVTSANNASSGHNKHELLRLNGFYFGSVAPNIQDVNGARSINLGCKPFDSLGFSDVADNPTSPGVNWADWGDFGAGTIATEAGTKMWIYGCSSADTRRSYFTPEFLSDNTTPDDSEIFVDASVNVSPYEGNIVFGVWDTSEEAVFEFPALSAITEYSALILKSPDGTTWEVTVDNAGAISAASL